MSSLDELEQFMTPQQKFDREAMTFYMSELQILNRFIDNTPPEDVIDLASWRGRLSRVEQQITEWIGDRVEEILSQLEFSSEDKREELRTALVQTINKCRSHAEQLRLKEKE